MQDQRCYDEHQLTEYQRITLFFGRKKQNVKQLILDSKLWPTTLKNMLNSCGLATSWPV